MALGDGDSWDETEPTDATTAIQIDDYNRDLRAGVRGRMALEHEWPSSQSATSEAGRHKYISLQLQSTKPSLSGTQIAALYIKTSGTSGNQLFIEQSDGSENHIAIPQVMAKVLPTLTVADGGFGLSSVATNPSGDYILTFSTPFVDTSYIAFVTPMTANLLGHRLKPTSVSQAEVRLYAGQGDTGGTASISTGPFAIQVWGSV